MLWKVFIAATVGTVVGAYAEPYITPKLPVQLATPTMAKVIHASIAGASAVGVYWAIGGAK